MPLAEHWVFTSAFPPSNAWGDPNPKPIENTLEYPRLRFDDAFHVVSAGGTVYFGSSADNKVYALDAETGAVRWQFYTDGPIRNAPTIAAGKVYVGSDDGRVYCLNAKDGKPAWQFKAALAGDIVLGAGKVMSLWPVRTGVLVDKGVAYFGAGVFPAEGALLYAVNAETGKLLWVNDAFTDGGQANRTPQGYLLASAERLFMPTGRTMPAAFGRANGRFLYQPVVWRVRGLAGGTYNVLDGETLISGTEQIRVLRQRDGKELFGEGRQLWFFCDSFGFA